MYNDLPSRVTALIESHILVGDAIAALESVDSDAELRQLLDGLQVVFDNQAALLERFSATSVR